MFAFASVFSSAFALMLNASTELATSANAEDKDDPECVLRIRSPCT